MEKKTTHQHKTLLRFITCGSVDDGKSTLIGRLLFDSKMIFEDQLAALEGDSQRFGTQGEHIDFALLVDGPAAEREQGITIDVAYRLPWYAGPALLPHLENVEVDSTAAQDGPFRMAVQWVNRASSDFRGFAGLISSGRVRPGDAVRVLPSGKTSTVARIVSLARDIDDAVAGQSTTLTLDDEIDCSRGDVIVAASDPLQVADQFEATLVWLDEAEMLPGGPTG